MDNGYLNGVISHLYRKILYKDMENYLKDIETVIYQMLSEYLGEENYKDLINFQFVERQYTIHICINLDDISSACNNLADNYSNILSLSSSDKGFPIFDKNAGYYTYLDCIPEDIRKKYYSRLILAVEKYENTSSKARIENPRIEMREFYLKEIRNNPSLTLWNLPYYQTNEEKHNFSDYEKELELVLKLQELKKFLPDKTLICDQK